MIHDFDYRMHGARLGIVRAINQAADTGMHQGARAHGARFNCSKQVAVLQTMVTGGGTGSAQGNDLGVGCRIGVGDVAVPSSSDDPAVANHDRTDRDFSGFESALGTAQGFFHPDLVGHGL